MGDGARGAPAHRPAGSPGARRGLIVLRFGEIFLKGKNRRAFEEALAHNARRSLRDLPDTSVRGAYLRLEVRHPPELERACLDRLARLFGLHSMSPARVAPRELEPLTAIAVAAAAELPPGRFKVEARRRDKRYPMTSVEIARHVGGKIAEGTALVPDMHRPDHVIRVEIDDDDQALIYPRIIAGPGGLPVGTAGKVGLLLSGGIDSPVAGWTAMKRGCALEAIYFHSFPFTGDKSKEKVADLGRLLARWHGPLPLHVVHFTEAQQLLRDVGPPDYAVVLYRRMMMRVASILTERAGGKALVTGESLGQVASQTLENLTAIEDAAALPVLRPLIGFDKLEIIARAQAIGTFETSIRPYDDTCALFVPPHPVTRARADAAARAEAWLPTDVAALATQLADAAERIELA